MTDRARICVRNAQRSLFIGIYVLLPYAPACALPPDLKLAQFYHTAWSAKEGAPTGIQSLAQTTDGYLWMGTFAGLFRFDGVHFERIDTVHNQPLPSTNVYTVWAPASGGLWVGYAFGGASFISNGRITNYGEREGLPGGTVQAFAQDGIGTVWMATTRGLKRFDGSRWIDVSTAVGLPNTHVSTLNFDRSGTLWIAVGNSIMFLQPGQHALTTTDIQLGGYVEFHESPDGTLWLMDDTQGVRALYVAGAGTNASKNWIRLGDSRLGPIEVPFIDGAGTFWMSTPTGIRRLRDPAGAVRDGFSDGTSADAFVLVDGLTGLASTGSFSGLEDREGNVWLGTAGGLHRFRESRLTRVDTRVDIASNPASFALAAGDDGAMLVGEYSKNGAFKVLAGSTVEAMPGPRDVTCAYRDLDGIVWFGGREGIWRFSGQRWVAIDLPVDNLLKERYSGVQAIAKERSGTLWVSVGHAVFRQVDGKWSRYGEAAVSMAADNEGRVWLGYPNNQVQIVDKDTVRRLSAADGLNIGAVLSIDAGPGHVWVGGDHGLARFDGRRFNAVTRQSGTTLRNVSGIIETPEGDLWLSTSEGAMQVPAEEVRRVVSDPLYAVRYTLLDFLDGMPGTPAAVRPLPTIAEGTDGRLWFATTNGIAWTDPRHVTRNALKPPVDVQSIIADGVRYEPSAGLNLPIRTRNLQITYTALSLSVPERVRFRYQFDADQPWQDVGSRREAYFTDLAPGHYKFRVIASNNDGVWNETGAAVEFTIPPAFVQTKWFLAIWAAAGAAVLWLLLMMRVRQVQRRMRGRLEAQLAERERIAQELHDTLLQGLLSASLQLSVANDQIAPGATAKPLVERVFQRLRQIVDEGRNAIRGLRTHHLEPDDLARAFSQMPQDLAADLKLQYRLIVEGTPQSLRPPIRDEVYRIGREALVNTFRHSGASVVEMTLDYARDHFRMVVRDNGCGMDPQVLRSGREGHWGLSGMHERAKKIGSRLNVRSADGAGTEIDLTVPASAAFEPVGSGGFRDWLARLYSRGRKL